MSSPFFNDFQLLKNDTPERPVNPEVAFSFLPSQGNLPAENHSSLKDTSGSKIIGPPSTMEWRCKVCNKTKDLHGDHLKGKTEVRSDCWPCAKKQTFLLMGHSDSAEPSPKTPVTPKAPAEKPTETTFGISAAPGGFGSVGQNTVAPSGFGSVFGGDAAKSPAPSFSAPKLAESSNQSAPQPPSGFKSAFGGDAAKSPAPSFSAPKPAESSNQSAPASGGFKSAFGGDAAKSPAPSFSAPKPAESSNQSAPQPPSGFKTAFSGDAAKSPAPSFSAPKPAESSNQSAPQPPSGFKSAFGGDAAKSSAPSFSAPKPTESPNQSAPQPPSGFKSAFGGDAAKSPAPSFSAPKPTAGEPPAAKEKGTAGSPATEWRCKVCNKTKDLHGDHLKGKTEVRSDCWPCAKKQTFILFEDGEPVKNQSSVARPSAVKGDAEEKDDVHEEAGHGPASSASVPPEKTTPQVDSGLNFDSIVADPRIPDELLEHLFLLPIDETTLHWRQPPFPPELIEKIDQVHSMSMHGEEYLSQFAEATFEQFESLSKSADVFEKDLSVCLDKLTVAEEVPKRLERLEKDSAAVKEALSHQSSELSKIVGMLKENKEELNAIKGILSNVESHLFNNYYAAQPSVAAPEPTRTLGNTTTSPQRHLENAFLKLK